jgi:hypothetical protein
MFKAIIESSLRPAILIPMLEEMTVMEKLMQSEHKRNHNDMEMFKSEMRITQLNMLLHILLSKAAA